MINNSGINGSVYANGPITGTGNVIKGGVVSAGASGSVDNIHATSTVYAHSITNSTVDGDAYYSSVITGSTVSGVKHPGSSDMPVSSMPISDSLIGQWETDAAAGGSATCTAGSYTITSDVTLGPKKIPCDLSISGNGTVVTLAGSVWVTGNISLSGSGNNGVQIKVSDSIGDKSAPLIADSSANPTTSGMITIDSSTQFFGSTNNSDSYVMLISQNKSAEQGGANLAINVKNGAAGNLLTYAPHGQISLQNNVTLREVTAYKLSLSNNAIVIYNLGLAQSLFASGSSGSWKIKKWRETF